MFKHVLFSLFFLLLSATASSAEWRLEVLDVVSREVKTYKPSPLAFVIPFKISGWRCVATPLRVSSRSIMCTYNGETGIRSEPIGPFLPNSEASLAILAKSGKDGFVISHRVDLKYK